MKKIYVLDTSVLLTDANSIFSFKNNDVVIPLKVLDEIDGQKKRQDSVGLIARTVIRSLDKLREKGSLTKGVRLGKGLGKLFVRSHDSSVIPNEWNIKTPDNMIISTALAIKSTLENEKRRVILVTNDINMRVKCDAVNILTEDYKKEKIIEKPDELYSGVKEFVVNPALIEELHNEGRTEVGDDEKFYPNQFVMLISSQDSKKTALARFSNNKLVKVKEYKKKGMSVQNLRARNREQTYALNLLMDPDIPVVSLIGRAGSGKTLMALAAGLEQITQTQEYGKLIVSRPVMPLGKDIGYLPGTLEDKMAPWLAPIKDNLEFLSQLNPKSFAINQYMNDGTIEIEALTYIRGRSIANAFIIIDEAQQLTQHELKTILTRVGSGTKIVLTGDVEQIDNLYVDETSNGLTYAVEKFKNYDLAGHVTLLRGERSEVATLAAKIL